MVLVKLLGTGALQPLPGRYLACASITCCGRSLLLDCGEGTQAAARAAGLSLLKVDLIALTHYHGDHIFGLPGLLQSMAMAQRTEKLTILGPEGLAQVLSPIFALAGELPYEIFFSEIPAQGVCLGDLLPGWPKETFLRAFSTRHRVSSCGYCFELFRRGLFHPQAASDLGIPRPMWKLLQHGQSIVLNGQTIAPESVMGAPRKGIRIAYTGDTAYFAQLPLSVEDSDLLISEATYGDREQETLAEERGHMCFRQAAETARRAKVKELWLTHYSPALIQPNDYLALAQAVFPETSCGEDGMEKEFRFDDRFSEGESTL